MPYSRNVLMSVGMEAILRRSGSPVFLTLALLAVLGSVAPVGAQMGGVVMEIYGMVEVAPGGRVVGLDVGGETIRFRVDDVQTRDRFFSMLRFLSDTRNRTPGLSIKGPARYVDLLRTEEPGKRVLRLTGLYYETARNFVVSRIRPVRSGDEERRRP